MRRGLCFAFLFFVVNRRLSIICDKRASQSAQTPSQVQPLFLLTQNFVSVSFQNSPSREVIDSSVLMLI